MFFTAVNNGPNSCEVGNPCNGSTCYNLASGGHQCFCMDGKWGVGCKYTVCEEMEEDRCLFPVNRCARKGVLCNGRGTCIWDDDSDSTYRSRCLCEPGWDSSNNCSKANGVRMQCKNNGACMDNGECVYILPEDYDGEDEELIFEDYECICDGGEF